MKIAQGTREPFGRLTAIGLGTLIGVQAVINTAMTVGLLPVTGLSLPLVSYGGSGLLANGLALGLLVNIAPATRLRSRGDAVPFVNRVTRS